jgi:phytanoyl-CoA hydroxylase
MRTELAQQEIDSYRENGFLVVERLFDDAELAEWRGAVEEAVAARATRLPTGDVEAEGLEGDDSVYIQRLNLWKTSPPLRQLLLDARIGALAAQLEGLDSVRLYHDQALIKEPYSGPTPWHQDMPYFSFTSRHCISIWLALADATLENGCLCYLPGSHRIWPGAVASKPGLGSIFDDFPEWREVQPAFQPVRAGGCIFHNGLSLHGAGSNMTNRSRIAMTVAFMPGDSTFDGNQNILTNEEYAAMTVGDPLDDDARWPLVYSATAQAVAT